MSAASEGKASIAGWAVVAGVVAMAVFLSNFETEDPSEKVIADAY